MKRTFTFLSSLFLTIGAMWAQSEGYSVSTQLTSDQLNEKTEPTMIAIKNLSATNNAYFVGNTGGLPYSKAEFNANGEAVFVWEPVTEGTAGSYYLKKLDGTYMQSTSPKDFGAVESAAKFTTTNPTSAGSGSTKFNGDNDSQAYINGNDDPNLVRFVNNNGTWINVQNGNSGTPTYNSGQGGWTIHYAYAVEKVTTYNVTYNFTYNNEVKYTQTATVNEGEVYPDYNVTFPYGFVAAAKPEGTVEETKTIEVALTVDAEKALPVEAAETVEGITKWYFVKLHSTPNYGRKYIQALEDGTIEWADTEVAEGEEESHLWGFVGDVWGMKLVSKTGKAVVSTSGDALLGDAAQATAFVVTASVADESGFCMQYPDKNYLNGQGGAVKSWSANDAGSTFLVELYEAPVVDLNDYTSYIKNANLSKTEESEKGWNTEGTKGIADGMVKAGSDARFDFSQTITLPAGQYKVAVKAAYRYGGDEAAEYAAIEAGTETHLVKLYAQTAFKNYEADVKNRWEGASDTDYAAGNGSVTVNGKFVPNSSAAVQKWFDNGQYVNELVFNVQEESEVKLGLLKEAGITSDYTNIGAWTLTRIGDAEFDLNEEDFDLTGGTWSDVTSYIKNADLSSKEGWTVVNQENYAADRRVMEFYAGWGAVDRSSGSIKQEVLLPAGIYRISGNAFFRYGRDEFVDNTRSLGKIVAGDNFTFVPTQASDGNAGFGDADKFFYNEGKYATSLEFTLDAETETTVGYEAAFEKEGSWFVVGGIKLEKKVTLKDNFMAQAAAFSEFGQSNMAMYSLEAVQLRWADGMAVVEPLYAKVYAGERVLKAEVEAAMEMMTTAMAEMKAVIEYYDGKFTDTKFAMYEIQDNSTPNSPEAFTAFDDALAAALNVRTVATVAELEAKVADMEAARQTYVRNAVPTEGSTFDMTFLIADAAVTSKDAWTNGSTASGQQYAGAPDNTYLDWCNWNGAGQTVDMYQELTNMPTGVYTLTAATRAEARMTGELYADTAKTEIHHVGNTGNELEGGWGWTTVENIIVVNGKMTIGFKTTAPDNGVWAGADNFSLKLVGAVPESTLLPLKKEAFTARKNAFDAYSQDELNNAWTMINNNYFWPVSDAVAALADTLDRVVSVAIIDEAMAAMDEAEAMVEAAYAVGAEYNYFKNIFETAAGNYTAVNEEEVLAAMGVLEGSAAAMIATIEELEAATQQLKEAYILFISNARAAEGTMFDVTFFINNAEVASADGWTNANGRINAAVYEGAPDDKALDVGWWTSNIDINQVLPELPAGEYVLSAFARSNSPESYIYAKAGEEEVKVTLPQNGDEGGDFGNGWSKISTDTFTVAEGNTLTIGVFFHNPGATFGAADNFALYYAGAEKPEEVEVTEVSLNTTWGELNEVGATLQLTATVTPENATDATITWSSSHPEIVTVVDGLVTVIAAAQEQVEIKATAANGVSASCWLTVYVVEPGTVTGIKLNATWKDLEVKSGDTFQLVATVEPADATDKTVTWTSNADFATVDANGLVTFTGTPEDGGTVTITATASNGMTATCMLSVTFVADDTAIESIKADTETVIYDIHGRRVTEMTKGVYIVNGKKVVKK